QRVQEVVLGAFANQDVPFDRVLEVLQSHGRLGGAPLSRTMFALLGVPARPARFGDLVVTPLEVDNGVAKFDLLLGMQPVERGLEGWVKYKTELFHPATIDRLVDDLTGVLEAAGAHPERSIAEMVGPRRTPSLPAAARLGAAAPGVPSAAPPQAARPAQPSRVAPRTPMERDLAAIWQRVLGVPSLGVHDTFLDLGGHSLKAVLLFAEIRRALGADLPLHTLLQAPTVEAMARVLEHGKEAGPASLVVAIQPQGTRIPLFLVHGVTGHGLHYHNLVPYLGGDQPLYGIQAPEPPCERIEAMAAYYVEALLSFRPTGPYLLGGYCFGGVVAYEMARLLASAGKEVPLLVLMDAPNPAFRLGDLRWDRELAVHLLGLVPHWAGALLRHPAAQGKRVWRAAARSTSRSGEPDGAILPDELAGYWKDHQRIAEAHLRAWQRFVPRPYAGRIALIRTNSLNRVQLDPWLGWGGLAQGELAIRVARAPHGDVIYEPHVRRLAARVRESLEAAVVSAAWAGAALSAAPGGCQAGPASSAPAQPAPA
ncbi:MAG: thioesterase domain-containing protein, partial [Candidatus Latescibacterota bacterium]